MLMDTVHGQGKKCSLMRYMSEENLMFKLHQQGNACMISIHRAENPIYQSNVLLQIIMLGQKQHFCTWRQRFELLTRPDYTRFSLHALQKVPSDCMITSIPHHSAVVNFLIPVDIHVYN